MKRVHKKILIVIRLKVVEILIALGCIIMFSFTVCGFAWLVERIKVAEAVTIIFAWIIVGIVGAICLTILGGAIYGWIGWNWNKAEKIIMQKEKKNAS